MLQAIILAGADGRSLRPVTYDIPPAMIPICGKPLLERLLDWLGDQSIREAVIATGYLPGPIRSWFAQHPHTVQLQWIGKNDPMPVFADSDDLLIVMGDTFTDEDIGELYAYHKRQGSEMTVAVETKEEAACKLDPDGRVTEILDVDGMLRGGIYLLRAGLITKWDSCGDFIADLVLGAKSMYCFTSKRMNLRPVDLPELWQGMRRTLAQQLDERPVKGKNITVNPPVYIGENSEIGEGAVLGPDTVIENGCSIGRNAVIAGAMVADDCRIGDFAEVTHGWVCHGSAIKTGARIRSGAVLGAGTVVGAEASVAPGVRIWPGHIVANAGVADRDVRRATQMGYTFEETKNGMTIAGEPGMDLTPIFAVRMGAATGSAAIERLGRTVFRIGVGCANVNTSINLKAALVAGLISTGCTVWDYGDLIPPAFDFLCRKQGADIGIYTDDRSIGLIGHPPPGLVKEIEIRLSTGDVTGSRMHMQRGAVDMTAYLEQYSALLQHTAGDLRGMTGTVRGIDRHAVLLLTQALAKAGLKEGEGLLLHIGRDARRLSLRHPKIGTVWPEQTMVMAGFVELLQGRAIYIPEDAPAAFGVLAERFPQRVVRGRTAGNLPFDPAEVLLTDALRSAAVILSYCARAHTDVAELMEALPPFAVTERNIFYSGSNPQGMMDALSGAVGGDCSKTKDGVRIQKKDGVIFIKQPRGGKLLRIRAEAETDEISDELCNDIAFRIDEISSGFSKEKDDCSDFS